MVENTLQGIKRLVRASVPSIAAGIRGKKFKFLPRFYFQQLPSASQLWLHHLWCGVWSVKVRFAISEIKRLLTLSSSEHKIRSPFING